MSANSPADRSSRRIGVVVVGAVCLALASPARAGAEAPVSPSAAPTPPPASAPARAGADEFALVAAARAADAEAVERLLKAGAEVDQRQPDGATALHWAAFRDDGRTAALLIGAGAAVNAVNELGATPLWLAAENGSAPMIERLLAAGADAKVALPEGETPLMTAARSGSADGVRALLEAGADVNAAERSRGQTALMWAVAQGHDDVTGILVRRGADVEARSKTRPRLMHAEGTNASQYDQGVMWNRGGFTPLLFAARHGRIAAVEMLLAGGADVDSPAPTGASPLAVAAHSGHAAFAARLLEFGADPNAMGAGYTALHAAVLRGDRTLVRSLLAHGADPGLRLRSGTPLRRASQDWAFAPALVSATPYWLAAWFHEAGIMRDLAEAGADPRSTTLERWRAVFERAGGVGPPHIAGGFIPPVLAATRGPANRGRFFNSALRNPDEEERRVMAAVRTAIELGADADSADLRGDTPMHAAAQRNFTTVVRFLAEHGADLDAKNAAGRTPLDLARAAEATRARIADPSRYPAGNSAEVLRELGAEDERRADSDEQSGQD